MGKSKKTAKKRIVDPAIAEMVRKLRHEVSERLGPNATYEERRDAALRPGSCYLGAHAT